MKRIDQRRNFGLLFVICAMLMAPGCVTQDKIKKANGHYQEGLASIEGDRQQAFVSFQKAIQLNPKHKEAHYSLGHLYALQGRYDDAEREFQTAAHIDGNYSEAHNYLGQVYARQKRWPQAIRSYRRALENPLYATPDIVRFNLGVALAQEREYDAAAQAFEDALLVSPSSVPAPAIYLELGRVYAKIGDDAKARDALSRVSGLDKEGSYAVEAAKIMERVKP